MPSRFPLRSISAPPGRAGVVHDHVHDVHLAGVGEFEHPAAAGELGVRHDHAALEVSGSSRRAISNVLEARAPSRRPRREAASPPRRSRSRGGSKPSRFLELLPFDRDLDDGRVEFRLDHDHLGLHPLPVVQVDDEVGRVEQLARHREDVAVLLMMMPVPKLLSREKPPAPKSFTSFLLVCSATSLNGSAASRACSATAPEQRAIAVRVQDARFE